MASEREIWTGIPRGDVALFEAFYRERAPGLKAYLRQMLGDVQAAEDVAQDVFAQLWKRPDGFDPDRGTLRAYLYGIARNQALEWWRHQRPSDEPGDERIANTDPELRSVMGDALRRLPEEQRTLLWLREVEGHSYAELALTLKIPVGTVRSRIFAARIALRKVWHSKRCMKGGLHEL